METILSVKDLSVRLDGQPIIENISFELPAGENMAILGPNGSGKTILLKTLLGMLPHSGIVKWAPDAKIGYVPQKIEADRHLPLTFENLFEAKKQIAKLAQVDVKKAIEDVGITTAMLHTPVGHLSGGQFQRCLIAFALLGRSNVLILDEPTASIDENGQEEMYELIHRLQDEYTMTAIVVSHDLSFVHRYSTKVLCLNHRNLCFGDPEDVLTTENLEKLFGGPLRHYHHLHKS